MNPKDNFPSSKILYICVVASLVFFVIKGISYALINSYAPLIFILIIIGLLLGSLYITSKTHRKFLRVWAVLIILWASVRLGLGTILQFDTTLTESHLREQFGVFQIFISVGMLGLGITVLKLLGAKYTS